MNHATEVFRPLQADDPPMVAGYRLVARLGAGGMGRVYLSHTQGGRPVAIKVVRPELADDPAFRRRFRREVEAARRVRGAYTAELIDADADGTPPWAATLYVPGPSLTEAVARRGPLPAPAVLWLMAGVAEALQAIHGAGIVHRDLKPSNVLLAADGPRVIDFGISLASDFTSHTATGATVGTPHFMAPEQASGGEVTAATDVFALGQTAAFAALGRPLYGDGSAVGVLYRIVHDEPDLSVLPEQLRPLFARCLAAAPEDRAGSGGDRRVVPAGAGRGRRGGRGPGRLAGRHGAGGDGPLPGGPRRHLGLPGDPRSDQGAHAAAGRHAAADTTAGTGGETGAQTALRPDHDRGRDGGGAGADRPGVDGRGRGEQIRRLGGGRTVDARPGEVRTVGRAGVVDGGALGLRARVGSGGGGGRRSSGSVQSVPGRVQVTAGRHAGLTAAEREDLAQLREAALARRPQGRHPLQL
ncbi:putative Serine/threonine-protein kinase AfsK [Streptomyces afghaniensis 772]|uniref:Putative Serine/threonine-protein kinase AfsK n=1 Tax=Streptomyces afghaniensis 772 TaxID=1283301 RepID=S4MN98_9ACTN|nr:putative Serine/threonine-protein kinase AfsK [Streptomyces afghaniensis 772]